MKNSSQKKWKRILAMVVAVVMVIGLCPAMAWVKAAEVSKTVYTTTISTADATSDALPLVLQDQNGNSIDGSFSISWDFNYKVKDSESGLYKNGKRISSDTSAYQYANAHNVVLYLGGCGATAGDVFTVKGSFIYEAEGQTITFAKPQSYLYTGTEWKKIGTTTVKTMSVTATNWANGADHIYLKFEDYNTTELTINGWNNRFRPMDENSGLFVETSTTATEPADGGYAYQGDAGPGFYMNNFGTLNAGDTVTIKGSFYSPSTGESIRLLNAVTFTWNGDEDKWTKTTDVFNDTDYTRYSGSLTYSTNGGNAAGIYLNGDTSLDGYKINPGEDNWDYKMTAMEGEQNGVFFNGSKVTENASAKGLFKFSNYNNWWYVTGFNATNNGDVVTIKGDFIDNNANKIVSINEVSFVWDGTAWSEGIQATPVTLTLEGAEQGDMRGTAIYLAGNNGLATPNWDDAFTPVDETAGVWVGSTRAGGSMKNYGSERWYVDGFAAAQGDTITIKGLFKCGGAYVDIAEAKFTWNGSTWENYVEYTYSDVSISGMSTDTGISGSSWFAYFGVNGSLPSQTWDDGGAYTFDIVVNDVPQEVTVKNAGYGKLFFDIPLSVLPKDTQAKVVIRSGKYKSSKTELAIGLNLTEDFTFYASKYGWSTKDTILEVAAKPFFTKVVAGEAYSGNGITLNSNIDDGAEYDGGWEKKLYPVIKGLKYDKNGAIDTSTLYFDCGENGLWKGSGAEVTFTNAQKMPLVKLGPTNYVAYIGDSGNKGETSGDTFIVGGLFHDENGRLIEFERIQVTWDGSDWTQTFLAMDDTGLEADLNADGVTDSHDLVRMLRHQENAVVSINTRKMDINNDGVFDASDVVALRKILVGKLSYYGGTAEGSSVPYGTPTYSTKRVIEKTAYSCPAVGTWNEAKTEFTPYADADIDVALQKYKAAGFTLLNSEFVAEFADKDFTDEANEPLRVLLEAAQRNGLGVIVSSAYINTALRQDDLANSAYSSWKTVVPSLVFLLSSYPAFKGFMMSDELSIQYADNYKAMAEFIHENYPKLVLHSSQLPVTAYTVSGLGAAALTKDTATNNTKELAYKDYVKTFGTANGMYTFDMYPLIYSADKIFGSVTSSEYSVNSEWYDNLKWVSEVAKDKGFKTGVTIQSCKLAGKNSLWSTYERYAPTEKADIGFQIYTAMAYGMQEFNYFTYMDHPKDTTVEDAMNDNAQVYTAVQSINQEIDSFANVFKAFTWKDTLDIAAGATNTSTGNARLTSVSAANARAFVGCMKDADGFDGYMVANAEGPRAGKTATVTLIFKSATKAMIYKGTSCETVSLTDGVCPVSLAAGEGAFMIPIR